ncbi:hypothetical protein Tco_0044377 [Tanacetum coccineum]
MIGCKVMRTLASVEFEIMLILGLRCCLSSSSVRCLESVMDGRRMSTPVFVDLEISTQADGAQISRVPVPLPEDPYEAIRQAYLDGRDTESEPIEDPVETEMLESPLTVAPPTSLPESTLPTLVPILRRTKRMAVRVPPAMSLILSASMAEVAAMSESAFHKRFGSSYESSLSSSPSNLPLRKRLTRWWIASELEEDSEEDYDEGEDEDPAAGDESLAAGDKGPGMDDESHGMDDESHGLDDESHGLDDEGHSVESDGFGLEEEEEAVPGGSRLLRTFEVKHGSGSAPESERPERVSASRQSTLTTWTDPEDGMVYIDVPAYPQPTPPIQTPPSPEWTSGSLPISPSPSIVPSPISSPMIPLTVPSPVATPATAETKGFLPELGAQVEIQEGLIRDHAWYQFRSLEYEQERVLVTFRAIWRLVLALESWAGQTDAQRVALWHVIGDMQGENQDLRLQLAEERRARLELAEVVDSMRRGQKPKGDV